MSDNPKIIYGTLDEIEPIVSSQEAWNEFPEHIQQYLRNKSGSDLLRSFGAYWLLKKHISSEQFQSLSFTASGKPILQKKSMAISLSHSGHFFACAIFPRCHLLGIDIQEKRPYSDRVAIRLMTEWEFAVYETLPDKEKIDFFYQIWCGKEALGKALGTGLLAVKDSCFISQDRHFFSDITWQGKSFYLLFQTIEDYQACICADHSIKNCTIQKWIS